MSIGFGPEGTEFDSDHGQLTKIVQGLCPSSGAMNSTKGMSMDVLVETGGVISAQLALDQLGKTYTSPSNWIKNIVRGYASGVGDLEADATKSFAVQI
ncbi:hypothetical protein EVAR_54004_1 [Eumeta japonica]|uniref:Uncharacterized protein n=1 Tax=Eumeta variegata TaxID=151549 RepID=A0A4C1YU96_EUMVA|nr:hypothetical protein EVAR_54004_1 [Eumeta japonica]